MVSGGSTDKAPRSLLSIIATSLLVLSILSSGGLFVYKIYLNKQKDSLSASLDVARGSFEKETIDELSLFDKRTESAKKILSNHIIMSPMFSVLGEITIPSVQYINFQQQTNDKGFLINIKGLARDYRSIALQADAFNSTKGLYFKNVLFSNLEKNKDNYISFDLKFNVDPALLSYENSTLQEQTNNYNNPTTPPNPLSQDLSNQTQ